MCGMNVCVHECVDVILCWVWPIYIYIGQRLMLRASPSCFSLL